MITDWLNKQVSDNTAPTQKVGIAGFTMTARLSDQLDLKSRIPVTYVEDGTYISEHIINEPLTVQITGVVGDVYIEKSAVESVINRTNAPLGKVLNYLPYQTRAAAQKINGYISQARDIARKLDDIYKTGKEVLDFGNKSPSNSLQAQFVSTIKALHDGKQMIVIDTLDQRFEQMRITSVSFIKDATSGAINYRITAQQMRFASAVYAQVSNGEPKKNPSPEAAEFTAPKQTREVALPSTSDIGSLREQLLARGVVQ